MPHIINTKLKFNISNFYDITCTLFLLDLFFDPEDGGDMFLRNVCCLSTDYTSYIPEDITLYTHRYENLKS
jgi:hypothetical protein